MPKSKVIASVFLTFLLLFFCFILYSQISIEPALKMALEETAQYQTRVTTKTPTPLPSPTATIPSTEVPTPTNTPTPTPLPPHIPASDIAIGLVSIEIPAINVNSVIDVAQTIDTETGPSFTEPQERPLWIPPSWSVEFGLHGITMVYGHRQWGPSPKVFSRLDKVEIGDTIVIFSPTQRFTYRISEIITIQPEDIWTITNNHNQEALTNNKNQLMLITCTPWGTNLQRLLVFSTLEEIYALP